MNARGYFFNRIYLIKIKKEKEMDLKELGWNESWQKHLDSLGDKGLLPARVAREDKDSYLILGEQGEWIAKVSGNFLHKADSGADFPAVGDWVTVQNQRQDGMVIIENVLQRKSKFSRKEAGGRTEEQVLAVNIDTVFLVSGLDGNFSLRRIERYLTLAWDSGASPVILLNKSDLCDELEACIREVETVSLGVPVFAMSATQNQGVDALSGYIIKGKTVVFLGSSGVGKSTIVNALLGEDRQEVNSISDAMGKGKHTTTRRELIMLPGGGLMIDTPGMRELQVWGEGDGLKRAFNDIEEIAKACRFRDCRHDAEPGCAVRNAVENGFLDPERFHSYRKLQKEFQFLARRDDNRARLIEKKNAKRLAKEIRRYEEHHREKW
jgi:ribosome biogenesis GTPase / thiamine phosphate phosphatase